MASLTAVIIVTPVWSKIIRKEATIILKERVLGSSYKPKF